MIREAILVVLGQRGLTARRMGSRISTPFGLSRIQTDPSLNWLPDAFAALKDALEIEPGATIDCLVLRPLGLGKILELPPARAGALRSLATTNIERLFPVTPEAWTADAQPLERPRHVARSSRRCRPTCSSPSSAQASTPDSALAGSSRCPRRWPCTRWRWSTRATLPRHRTSSTDCPGAASSSVSSVANSRA